MREKRERNKIIIERIKRGDFLMDIAREFNISPSRVSKIKRHYLIEKKKDLTKT